MKGDYSPVGIDRRPLTVLDTVADVLERRDVYIALAGLFGTPLYVIDGAILQERAAEFQETFAAHLPNIKAFFPVKTNSHPCVLKTLIGAGMGIEVASGMELELALACGANQILFNGPAKTIPELSLALTHPDRVTVIMDSLNELRRLVALANQTGVRIRTGVRLSFENHGHWRKFGIAPADLAIFIEQARSSEHIDLKGLHFHTSWNMDPGVQVQTLVQLGKILSKLRPDMLGELAFIDIGGGFWPPQGQWLPASGSEDNPGFFTTVAAAPLNEYADRIAGALREHVFTHLSVAVYAEPGRWIVNDAVQILLKILDIKEGGLVITDGGTNLVGWERFEHEYFPLINLTRPGLTERPSLILGSLCTPDDLWGRSYFGQEIGLEDVFLIPMQGAYTYSLRQRFIKPLPATVFLPAGSEAELVEEANP